MKTAPNSHTVSAPMFIDKLEPPLFLVAMPQVRDPFFNRAVVLLLDHTPDGSFGIVINRPLDVTVASLAENLGVNWSGPTDERVYFGGPVEPTNGMVLFSGSNDVPNSREAAPGLQLSNALDTLKEIAGTPPPRHRLTVGFAGWGSGQLEEELSRNDWLIAPYELDLVFTPDPTTIWAKALDSIDVRPESLPSWTTAEERGN